MLSLIVLSLAAAVSGSLVTYPNGAVVPLDPANQAATAAHLAATGHGYGYLGYAGVYPYAAHYIGKRDADADASLVGYPNGALVPYNPYLHGGYGYAHAGHGYYGAHVIGKRDADADAEPWVYGAGVYGYAPLVHYNPLVAHPNGAVVPLEPLAVVQARAEHLAAKAAAH